MTECAEAYVAVLVMLIAFIMWMYFSSGSRKGGGSDGLSKMRNRDEVYMLSDGVRP